jgi:hypothetical protein
MWISQSPLGRWFRRNCSQPQALNGSPPEFARRPSIPLPTVLYLWFRLCEKCVLMVHGCGHGCGHRCGHRVGNRAHLHSGTNTHTTEMACFQRFLCVSVKGLHGGVFSGVFVPIHTHIHIYIFIYMEG